MRACLLGLVPTLASLLTLLPGIVRGFPIDPDETVPIVATTAHEGEFGTGEAYVVKSGEHEGLRCPVVIVEGFDRSNSRDWPSLRSDLASSEFGDGLLRSGRDLVLLNFTDGTTYIQRNAHVLTALLAWVNGNRQDAAQPLVVVGFSMGGLVARYSLDWCETHGTDHGVDVFVSFDSPQEGANIPLGVQEAVAWMDDHASLLSADEQAKITELLASQNCPAARQMTLCHYETADNGQLAGPDPLRVALETEFTAMGEYPSLPRKVGISNGSGHGITLPFGAGDPLGQMTDEFPIYTETVGLTLDVYAVSDSPARLFEAFLDYPDLFLFPDDETYMSTKYAAYAYDAAPGAYSEHFSGVSDALPANATLTMHQQRQCFIPTVSALGLPLARLFDDLSKDADLVDETPFDEISYAVDNEDHVDLNERTTGVLVRNIFGDLDLDGDGVSDLYEYEHGMDGRIVDSDGDGMDDGWEVAWDFDPLVDDSDGDADGDGATNLTEYLAGSNPRMPASDRWSEAVGKLRQIGQAIQAYQATRSGALPGQLTDLVDDGYLTSDVLLCTDDPTAGGDPHPYDEQAYADAYESGVSFFYRFSGANYPTGGTWHDVSTAEYEGGAWTEAQFPVVQCFYGTPAPAERDAASATVLNLALDLTTVFATRGDWAAEPLPGAEPELRVAGDVACPLNGTVQFPLWSPWADQPTTFHFELAGGRGADVAAVDGRFLVVSLADEDPTPYEVTVDMLDGETVLDSRIYRVRPARQPLTLTLAAGWNLVGFPVTRADDPTALFVGTDRAVWPVSSACFWDAAGRGYVTSRPAPALSPGMWVYAETAGEVVAGAAMFASSSYTLPAGWSLVGVPADVALSADAAVRSCFAWDAQTLRYVNVLPGRALLETGRGYWLNLSSACLFNPDTGELTPVAP